MENYSKKMWYLLHKNWNYAQYLGHGLCVCQFFCLDTIFVFRVFKNHLLQLIRGQTLPDFSGTLTQLLVYTDYIDIIFSYNNCFCRWSSAYQLIALGINYVLNLLALKLLISFCPSFCVMKICTSNERAFITSYVLMECVECLFFHLQQPLLISVCVNER